MTPPPTTVVAGIDVGKSKLDAHLPDAKRDRQFNNDKAGRRALRNWLRKHGVQRAVFDPTGRYHRQLHQCLFDSGMETVLVNPLALAALRRGHRQPLQDGPRGCCHAGSLRHPREPRCDRPCT